MKRKIGYIPIKEGS